MPEWAEEGELLERLLEGVEEEAGRRREEGEGGAWEGPAAAAAEGLREQHKPMAVVFTMPYLYDKPQECLGPQINKAAVKGGVKLYKTLEKSKRRRREPHPWMLVYLALSLITLYLFVRDVGFSGSSEDTAQKSSQPTPYPLGSGIKVLPSMETNSGAGTVTNPAAPTKARVLDSPTISFSFCSG